MEQLHFPSLAEITDALAHGDAEQAFEHLSLLRPGRLSERPGAAALLEQASQKADELNAEPFPALPFSLYRLYEETGDRFRYESLYFSHYTLRNTANALCWLSSGEEKYRRELEDGLWALCDVYTWALPAHLWGNSLKVTESPAYEAGDPRFLTCAGTVPNERLVDLFSAMHAQDLAELLYIAGDRLSPIVVKRVRDNLQTRIFEPVFGCHANFFWETSPFNWAAVCAGSVGCAALYSIRDSKLLAPMLAQMLQALQVYISGFDDDGICEEGLSYWVYGFRHFSMFADLLYRRTAGAIDLFRYEKIRNIAHFTQKAMLNVNDAVSFSDCSQEHLSDAPLLHFLHRYDNTVELARDDGYEPAIDKWFSYCCARLEWYDPALMGSDGFGEADIVFREAEWLVARQNKDGKKYGFAAKAGNNIVSHNHNDVGSFIVDINGKQLLCDPGCGKYTRQYFDPKVRYDIFCCGSQGHSVPLVDGHRQLSGPEYRARHTEITVQTAADRLFCDMAPAYGYPALQTLTRELVFDKENGVVRLRDHFAFSAQPVSITERFVTPCKPRKTEDGIVLADGEDSLLVRGGGEVQIAFEKMPIHDSDDCKTIYTIDFTVPATREADFSLEILLR